MLLFYKLKLNIEIYSNGFYINMYIYRFNYFFYDFCLKYYKSDFIYINEYI